MRILVLSKRQYMGRDLLDDRYGRYRELPLALAQRGHEVRGLCLSYRQRPVGEIMDRRSGSTASVRWNSVNLGRLVLPGLLRFVRQSRSLARNFRPDVIWTGSDSFYGTLGQLIGKAADCRVVFDIYDHFETFASTRIPGVFPLYRRACRQVDGVTSFSQAMSDYIRTGYQRSGPLLTLVNGTDTRLFRPLNSNDCRTTLGLPAGATLIGTAGAITRSRGFETVFMAFERLSATRPDLHLVLAGPREAGLALPQHPHLHDLGMLAPAQVPVLLNALDLSIVPQRETVAGRYGFPYKAYEIMACGIPLVAAATGAMTQLLATCPNALYKPDDADDLERAIQCMLTTPCRSTEPVPDWDEQALRLEAFLETLATA
jgi:glycosyltransferase involved in cell wall biosynthesis